MSENDRIVEEILPFEPNDLRWDTKYLNTRIALRKALDAKDAEVELTISTLKEWRGDAFAYRDELVTVKAELKAAYEKVQLLNNQIYALTKQHLEKKESLEQEASRLREALIPFSKVADEFTQRSSPKESFIWAQNRNDGKEAVRISVQDCINAKAALAPSGGAERCPHGVHGTDCYECYPSRPEVP